ncbi:MAG: radical SAM protein [Candidatus Omnitrophota bacterium]
MKKILLLDPLGYTENFKHRHLLREWSGAYITGHIPFPPLDLMYAASFLRKHGHDVRIIEASINHWPHKKLVKLVVNEHPDFILISTTYYSLRSDKYLAMRIKESLPGVKIIFAGPPVIHDPALALKEGPADFVALGELELPVLNIMNGSYAENVAYLDGSKIVKSKRTLLDLDELVIPARDLIDNNAYRYAIFNRKNPVTAMSISRGCPHGKCNFCVSSFYTLGQIRYRNFDSIVEEINEIVFKYKIGEIFFRDQAFTANRGLIFKLCEYMLLNNIRIPWRSSTRVDLVDKQLLSLMHRAGCYQLSFGFESYSQAILDMANKGITVEQSRNASRWAKEAGLEVVGLFMCGMLGDTKDSADNLFKFALDLDVDYAQFCGTDLFPGTPYYVQFNKNASNFLSHEFVNKYTKRAFLRFYLRPKFLGKQLKKIRSFEDVKFLATYGLDAISSYF